MNTIQQYFFLLNNFVIWATLLTAFVCYGLLIDLCFVRRCNASWYQATLFWSQSLKHMLTALPLLGLLGTITGLLKTFTQMSLNKSVVAQEIISGGIGEAMFTTQLGLIMVIPGLLMLTYLNHKKRGWATRSAHEITH